MMRLNVSRNLYTGYPSDLRALRNLTEGTPVVVLSGPHSVPYFDVAPVSEERAWIILLDGQVGIVRARKDHDGSDLKVFREF